LFGFLKEQQAGLKLHGLTCNRLAIFHTAYSALWASSNERTRDTSSEVEKPLPSSSGSMLASCSTVTRFGTQVWKKNLPGWNNLSVLRTKRTRIGFLQNLAILNALLLSGPTVPSKLRTNRRTSVAVAGIGVQAERVARGVSPVLAKSPGARGRVHRHSRFLLIGAGQGASP